MNTPEDRIAGVDVRDEDIEVDLSVDEFFEWPRSLFSLFSLFILISLLGEHWSLMSEISISRGLCPSTNSKELAFLEL